MDYIFDPPPSEPLAQITDADIRNFVTSEIETRELIEIKKKVEDKISTIGGVSDIEMTHCSPVTLIEIRERFKDESIPTEFINEWLIEIANSFGKINPNNYNFSGLTFNELQRKLEREEIENLEIMRIARKDERDIEIEEEFWKYKKMML